ncbi:MAG: T9SS type A sorting domain-containing protein [Ignavibacteria bacterium]
MKKLFFTFTLTLFYIAILQASQDTSYTLLSSDNIDYKNPQFDKTGGSINYTIRDCIFAYEKWSSSASSKIAVRFINYNSMNPEVELTDGSSLNIHPSVAYHTQQFTVENNPGAVVFQSNRNGNWDIFFLYYNSTAWSVPVSIASDTQDEISPSITAYLQNNVLNFLVSYKKGNDIYIKNYFNGVWINEVNITADDSLDCNTPVLTKTAYSPSDFYAAYNHNENGVNSISYRKLQVSGTGDISFSTHINIDQPEPQNNLRFSNGVNYTILNYDYGTPGSRSFYSAFIKTSSHTIRNQSSSFNGENFGGTGSSHGDITSEFLSGYTLYAWIGRVQDSTQVNIAFYTSSGMSKFYVGNSQEETFINMSTKLIFGDPFTKFRIRVLWEKKINGRTALIESFKDGFLTSINNSLSSTPNNFSLFQNYPNPFNPKTIIKYSIPTTQFTILKVYNALGKEVVTLVNQKQNAGSYQVEFDGEGLPSGIYFYRITVYPQSGAFASDKSQSGEFTETRRMILIK